MSTVPSWLSGYAGRSASRAPRPRKPRAESEIPTALGCEIDDPRAWEFDGDLTRRVAVYDHNWTPARLVRRCGYQKCLRCREAFWSPDCVRVRMCDACKVAQGELPEPKSKPGPKPKGPAKRGFGEINFARQT